MKRRSFITTAAAGATAGTILGAPAIVHAQPAIRWRLASSFPKSLDTLFGAAELLSRRVASLTDGRFTISTHAGGEIVPALQVLDAVQGGTVEIGHTAMSYYFGKDPTFAFGTAVPFGLNYRQMNAWWYHGGGEKLYGDFLRKHGVVGFLAGNTGEQTGGWFRREINSVEDLRGLKFRISAFGGLVLSRLGVVPQTIAGGEIYTALERGAIDGVEWVGPHDDERLGFHKVAKFYYAQAWWEIGASLHTIVNLKSWESLPPAYQSALQAACFEGNVDMMARYDALNIQALKRLLAAGVQLRAFNNQIMNASYKAAQEVYAELNEKNPEFKRLYDHYFAFQRDQVAWQQVIENRMAQFMASVVS
jgi:TRAP-type mannitol/chloroaromatic compound transport system substrate-binding protein